MLTILLLAFVVTEPDPTKNLPPVVKFLGLSPTGSLLFEVTNPNSAAIPYRGYLANSIDPPLKDGTIFPLYLLEVRAGGVWKANGLGWCKSGVGSVSIPAKGKVTFEASAPTGDWDEMKVGLTWYTSADSKGSATAWSEPVRRKDVMPKQQP